TPLASAVDNGNLEAVKLLHQRGATIKTDGNSSTPLHIAISQNFDAIANYLLDARVPIDCRDSSGYTPLCRAVERGNVSAVRFALQPGADPEVACIAVIVPRERSRKMTPLEWLRREITRRKEGNYRWVEIEKYEEIQATLLNSQESS